MAENLLARNFTPSAPDRVWSSDINYIATDEGWLYLACVIDLFSRQVVGWSMQPHMHQPGGRRAAHGLVQTPSGARADLPLGPRAVGFCGRTRTRARNCGTAAAQAPPQPSSCQACHGRAGISDSGSIPNLAGQRANYWVAQLQAFKRRERKSVPMAAIADPLSESDMRNLAQH